MKILHVIDHLGLGGAQSALPDLLAAWPEPTDELHVLGLGAKGDLAERYYALPQVEVEQLNLGRWALRAQREVARRIRDEGCDIVHAHLGKSIVATLFSDRPPRTRLVVHLRAAPRHEHWMTRMAIRWWQQRADAFLAVSNCTAEEARQRWGISRTKLFTVYNCLNMERLMMSPGGDREFVRRRLGWAPGTTVFGYAGRMRAAKGLWFLLDAFQRVVQARRAVGLVLVGEGPCAAALRAAIRRRGLAEHVRLVGFQNVMGDWIEAFDAAVMPSLSEGLPMAVVEMMAAGKPVIATEVGGTSEIIEHGINGLLVPPADSSALAAAMLQVADAPAWSERLGHAARQQIAWMFSPEANSRRVRSIYSMLLQPSALQPLEVDR